jgi:hypothetical protein
MMALEITKERDIFFKLKSSSSSIAYDGLTEIRSNIIKTKEGFKILRENKILNELVNFLHKPNEKLLDVTLSILGNCCLDSDCRNEVSIRPYVLLRPRVGCDLVRVCVLVPIKTMLSDVEIMNLESQLIGGARENRTCLINAFS